MKDSRKPLFPEDDDSLPPLEDLVEEDESPEADAAPEAPAEPVHTPPAERFPPLDPATFAEQPEPDPELAPAPRRSHLGHNLLALIFALGTLGLIAYFALLWRDPSNPLNPLPPLTPLPQIITTTPLPPTATVPPSATPEIATQTFTPLPAAVISPQPSFTPAAFPFTLVDTGVDYRSSESGCDWSGITGTVTDLSGAPVLDYSVRIRDQDGPLNTTVSTGPEGYSYQVAELAQLAPYIVQLLDSGGEPVSDEYLVVTSDQCEQNAAVVDFVQNR